MFLTLDMWKLAGYAIEQLPRQTGFHCFGTFDNAKVTQVLRIENSRRRRDFVAQKKVLSDVHTELR